MSCTKPLSKTPPKDPCLKENKKEYCPKKPVVAPPPSYGNKVAYIWPKVDKKE